MKKITLTEDQVAHVRADEGVQTLASEEIDVIARRVHQEHNFRRVNDVLLAGSQQHNHDAGYR